jgi:parallel beta-helix repeat protein
VKCAQCGIQMPPGTKYCGNCGAPVAPGQYSEGETILEHGLAGSLTVETGTQAGQSFQLASYMRLGRTADNEIHISDPQLSRHHAAVTQSGSGYIVADLDSTNGTFLNEQKITAPQPLQEGDRIRVGGTTLVFRWMPAEAEPTVLGPAPLPAYVPATSWTPTPVPMAGGKPSSGPPIGMIVLGAGAALLVFALAAIALYMLFGNREGNVSLQPSPTAMVQVVTNTPISQVTMVVTNTPEPTSVATATAIPTPTPTAGPVTVRVAPDGSGDYASLGEAVAAVLPGSTIRLDPGTYVLPQPLLVEKTLALVGSGMDVTFVTGTTGDQLVHFRGPGQLTLHDITFRYEGTTQANVVVVENGEVDIAQSRFTGAIRNLDEKRGGMGLLLLGSTTGTIRDSRFEGNAFHGIDLYGQSQPTIQGNILSNNQGRGLVYREQTSGIARQNDCSSNHFQGILVWGQAQPALEANTCRDNGHAGILFTDSTAGSARDNECIGNRFGILVEGAANPSLAGNKCYDNSDADTVLWYDDFADPASGWWTGSGDWGEVRYQDGALHIVDKTTPESATVSTADRTFTDLIVEVGSWHVSGTLNNWHGVYCRYQNNDNWYVGAYSADGYYTGLAKVDGQTTEWVKEQSDAIKQGQGVKNQVRLECVGDHIRFWVNDQLLFDQTDNRLAEGRIGLDAESEDEDYTEVAYEKLTVLAP